MEENLPDDFTVLKFPEETRQFLQTNNMTENINTAPNGHLFCPDDNTPLWPHI